MSDINSIYLLCSLSLLGLFQILVHENLPLKSIIDALLANLSQKNDGELLEIIQQSILVGILTTFKELVNSKVIEELDVDHLIRQNFSNLQEGEQHLIAVLAFLQLLRSPGDAGTPEEAEVLAQKIEDLKELFRLTLFNSQITIHLMNLRDEKQERVSECPCPECTDCNARFILSIGWYIAAQEAHYKNMFAANLC
jgi:hypothetical protein